MWKEDQIKLKRKKISWHCTFNPVGIPVNSCRCCPLFGCAADCGKKASQGWWSEAQPGSAPPPSGRHPAEGKAAASKDAGIVRHQRAVCCRSRSAVCGGLPAKRPGADAELGKGGGSVAGHGGGHPGVGADSGQRPCQPQPAGHSGRLLRLSAGDRGPEKSGLVAKHSGLVTKQSDHETNNLVCHHKKRLSYKWLWFQQWKVN